MWVGTGLGRGGRRAGSGERDLCKMRVSAPWMLAWGPAGSGERDLCKICVSTPWMLARGPAGSGKGVLLAMVWGPAGIGKGS